MTVDQQACESGRGSRRRRCLLLVGVVGPTLVAMVILVKPLRVQFHRTMMDSSHDAYLRVRQTSLSEMTSRWMMDHPHRHRHELVRLGHLQRETYRFRSLLAPSREYQDSIRKLLLMSRDCIWDIGGEHGEHIDIDAMPREVDRLLAIVEAHDVAAAVSGPNETLLDRTLRC